MSKIVVALGGNALGNTPDEQVLAVEVTAKALQPLIQEGHQIVICHGNGPQVGMINVAFEDGFKVEETPPMPLAECTAMSQGYIGYHLQNAISKLTNRKVSTIITRCLVDSADPGFQNPTKPIGSFYSEEDAKQFEKETGFMFVEDSGRGWRRIVASPKPQIILEIETILKLLEQNEIVVAGGGGGIPVFKRGDDYERAEAVIDKDFCAELIAEKIEADYFFILTAVPKVAINFGKDNQEWLSKISSDQAEEYISQNQFAPGSMLPKVQAAIKFARFGKGNSVITSLENAHAAFNGDSGTVITK